MHLMTLNIVQLCFGLLQKQEKVWGGGKDIHSMTQRETHNNRQNTKDRWKKRRNQRERERDTHSRVLGSWMPSLSYSPEGWIQNETWSCLPKQS